MPVAAGGNLVCSVDDPEMEGVEVGGGHPGHVPEHRVHRFCDAEVADALIVEHLAGVEGSPARRVALAVVVPGLEVAALWKADAHRALAAASVAVVGLAQPVPDMVVDLAVVDEGALPIEVVTGGLVRLGNPDAA